MILAVFLKELYFVKMKTTPVFDHPFPREYPGCATLVRRGFLRKISNITKFYKSKEEKYEHC